MKYPVKVFHFMLLLFFLLHLFNITKLFYQKKGIKGRNISGGVYEMNVSSFCLQ